MQPEAATFFVKSEDSVRDAQDEIFNTGTQLYCLIREEHVCEKHVQSCYPKMERRGIEPATAKWQVQSLNHYSTKPHRHKVKT